MAEYIERAAFLADVHVGHRVRDYDGQVWVVTGRMDSDPLGSLLDRPHQPIVNLIGVGDNGEPHNMQGAQWVAVHIFELIPEQDRDGIS